METLAARGNKDAYSWATSHGVLCTLYNWPRANLFMCCCTTTEPQTYSVQIHRNARDRAWNSEPPLQESLTKANLADAFEVPSAFSSGAQRVATFPTHEHRRWEWACVARTVSMRWAIGRVSGSPPLPPFMRVCGVEQFVILQSEEFICRVQIFGVPSICYDWYEL